MAVVRPFRGLRPRLELAEKIASPPYDVLDSKEARERADNNPLSYLHVVKPEIDLDPSVDLYDTSVYQKGAENLNRLVEEKSMIQDETPLFYFYRQIMGDHQQVGLVACVSAEDYENDIIKKHEFTRREKEEDRIRHIDTQNAQSGPVFLTYPDISELNALQEQICTEKPEYDFMADDEVKHTLWLVRKNNDIKKICELFEQIPFLYVADGHHRSAAGTIVGQRRRKANPHHTGQEEYNFFLSVLFPKSHMKILPYNRCITDLKGLSKEEFLNGIENRFKILEDFSKNPTLPGDFSMYLGDGQWIKLRAKKGSFPANDPVRSIDSSILQENLLSPLLGIDDPRTDNRIKFVGGIRGTDELEKLVDSGSFAIAFSLYPTSIDQLISVADSGKVMPPKSTWFEPKLRSGIIVHLL